MTKYTEDGTKILEQILPFFKPDVTVIAAFYISTTDIAFNELEELVQSQLARYKHPRVIQRVKALPRTPNGKLIRASLRKLWNKNYD